MKKPKPLKACDTIGITATARKVSMEEIAYACNFLEANGFHVLLSPHLFAAEFQFAGADDVRANAFNEMLNNPLVDAIWCARGGYGSARIIEKIDWHILREKNKWIMGFSDITALHNHAFSQIQICTMHSPMPFAFEKQTETSQNHFLSLLMGAPVEYRFESLLFNKMGVGRGKLIGGNLSVLYSLLGSSSQPDTTGCILFLEDLDEYLYHIDRMMTALKRAGMLQNLAGLLVGGMTDMHDNKVRFGCTAEEIIRRQTAEFDYPVAMGFPSGHLPENLAWIHGAEVELHVNENCTLRYL